jgi:hypothetical protein
LPLAIWRCETLPDPPADNEILDATTRWVGPSAGSSEQVMRTVAVDVTGTGDNKL